MNSESVTPGPEPRPAFPPAPDPGGIVQRPAPSPAAPPAARLPWRAVLLGGGLVALVAAVAGGGWWAWKRFHRPDMLAVLETNSRGVGLMEQFEYEEAIPVFEQVVKMAPDWRPGHINLGIALLNTNTTENRARARQVFEGVLKQDPDDPYAHHCLGVLLMYERHPEEAIAHFEAVLQKDPTDPHAWFFLGQLQPQGSPRAIECYQKALEYDPYQGGALNQVMVEAGRSDPKKQEELKARFNGLNAAGWIHPIEIAYKRMGKYAEVIGTRKAGAMAVRTGPLPEFKPTKQFSVRLAPGTRWAAAADFGKDDVGRLRALVRRRFGGTIVVFDYNGDGKPDLFVAGAVVEKGKVRNLLLRNDGGGKFVDVTAEAGLSAPHPTLGCVVADFDNDGHPDLLLTGAGSQKLFRNTGKGSFQDVTAKAGLDKLTSVCLGACFIDLDQDSDLDLLIAEYAATPADALKALKGEKAEGGGLAVYLQVGEAPPVRGGAKAAPLAGRFKRATRLPALRGPAGPVVGLAASDLDGDRDLDLLVLADRTAPAVVLNDRLLQFRRKALPDKVVPPGTWNGALVLDVDHHGRSDVLLVGPGQPPRLLLNRARPTEEVEKWFEDGGLEAPPLLQAVTIDVDLDGWADVIGLSADRVPVLLYNQGGRLAYHPNALGPKDAWPGDLLAVTALAVDGEGFPGLLVWSESQGLRLHENQGNGNHGLYLELTGFNAIQNNGNRLRCNADGFGAWAAAEAGDLWAGQENTTLSAGLGQSRQPLVLGLGRFEKADVVLLRWPDITTQAELDRPSGLTRVGESNRRRISCPVLFAWDGERFAFVTDFLGAGSVGERGPDGSCRPPRPVESVKIESHQFAPRDGEYVLQVAEPMDEVTYLDHVRLVVVDHPAKLRVYPDERFHTSGPAPTQELIAFDREVFPARATDHRGRDVTAALKAWDRKTVDGFARRSWLGFAEEHFVELDFADRLASFKPGDRLVLCLAGWTDYPYPESIWAAHQAGVGMLPPVLERLGPDGKWHKLCEAGFPAGLPKMMLLDVTGKLTGPRCKLRLRTNLQVYWDQAFVAAGCRTVPVGSGHGGKGSAPRATALDVSRATLSPCGLMQEYSPDGKEPTVYAFDRYDNVPVVRPSGRLTRYGEVTELLREADDRFVIFGPGDLLTLRFDARKLPPLPEGWKRSFVLRTRGYCKDTGPFTAHGDTVEPLPFRAMRNYPPGPGERYPDTKRHRAYLEKYNTRAVKPDGFPPRRRR